VIVIIKRNKFKAIIIFALLVLLIWIIWSNLSVEINCYTISADNIPKDFEGFRIAHISDLHNAEFGKGNSRLLEKLRANAPDMIAITGDSIDSRRTDMEITINFLEKAMDIAPCYFVVGNHEARFEEGEYLQYEARLKALGVVVLHNEAIAIEKNGKRIIVCGVDDPMFDKNFSNNLKKCAQNDEFTVLLSHRPERFEEYVENGYYLILSGHAHGGQFRIPFLGGLFVPGQGFFPEYDSGLYTKGGTNMIVSRGIGNSIIPIRINNRPEIIFIELEYE